MVLSPGDLADNAGVGGDLGSTVCERVGVRCNELALVEGAGTKTSECQL